MFGLTIKNIGNIKSIKLTDIPSPKKMSGEEVFLEHTAFGFNHEDYAISMGRYPFGYYSKMITKSDQSILGLEATGVIAKTGSRVRHLGLRQRVFYSVGLFGSYCSNRTVHNSFVLPIPDTLSNDTIAACMRKGLMIHSLLYKTVSIQKDSIIMIHNAADSFELMLCSWAANVGLKVIGTVTDDKDIPIAEKNGCFAVINREKTDLVQEVAKHTNKRGIKVLYDSVGRGIEKASISCLEPFGVYIHYHSKNGFPDISPSMLAPKSLFLTAPSLELYKSNKTDLISGAEAVFKALEKGFIKPNIFRLPIKDAGLAFDSYDKKDFRKNFIFNPS